MKCNDLVETKGQVDVDVSLKMQRLRQGLAERAAREGDPDPEVSSRLRKSGGGRKRLTETDPPLSVALDHRIASLTRGDVDDLIQRPNVHRTHWQWPGVVIRIKEPLSRSARRRPRTRGGRWPARHP